MDSAMRDVSQAAQPSLSAVISQYRGAARFTRLLKIADNHQDINVIVEALLLAHSLAKKENQLG